MTIAADPEWCTWGYEGLGDERVFAPYARGAVDLSEWRGRPEYIEYAGSPQAPPGLFPEHAIFALKRPDQYMTVIGSSHATDPDNLIYDVIAYEIAEWEAATVAASDRRVIVCEGRVREACFQGGFHRSIAKGETQFLVDYAEQMRVPILSLSRNWTEAHTVVEYFDSDKVVAYYALRTVPEHFREPKSGDLEAYLQGVLDILKATLWEPKGSRFKAQDFMYDHVERLFKTMYDRPLIDDEDTVSFILGETIGHMFSSPEDSRKESEIRRISRAVNYEVDKHMSSFLTGLWVEDGLSPFCIVGKPHERPIRDQMKDLGNPVETSWESGFFPTISRLGHAAIWDPARAGLVQFLLQQKSELSGVR